MSSAIQEAIDYIDSLIETIVSDMIFFRSKRLEASQKFLDKLKELMGLTTYTYRLGDLLDKAVKVETDRLKHFDLTKPSLKIRYKGQYTRLWLNGNYIDVPEVPIFVFETKNTDRAIHEMGISMIERNLWIKFPVDANVSEEPNVENAYGKYYKLVYVGPAFEYKAVETYVGKKLAILGFAFQIDSILSYHSYKFERILTIDGEMHPFDLYIYFGKIVGQRYIDPKVTITDIEYPCTFIEMFTTYGGTHSYIFFGNEVTAGEKKDNYYERDVLIIYAVGRPLFYVME